MRVLQVVIVLFFGLGGPAHVYAESNSGPADAGHSVYDPRAKSEMDDLASAEDVAKFTGALATDWALFVEDRMHSIRRTTGLPKRWLTNPAAHGPNFTGTAQPGEFYVFQVGLFAAKAATGPVALGYENLPGIRCFNLGGTNYLGQAFKKSVRVEQGKLQALWFGLDVPKDAAAMEGKIVVTAAGVSQTVGVKLSVAGATLDDHGDRDAWRLSRLRWLDSTIGLDDNVVTRPFAPIVRSGKTCKLLGRELVLGDGGLPGQIRSYFNADNTGIARQPTRELLAAPFRFVVETDAGAVKFGPMKMTFTRELHGAVDWIAVSQAQGITLEVAGLLEYDGFADCHCRITSRSPLKVKDIRLEVDVAQGADTYFMGLGKKGGKLPGSFDWKWNANVNQDGFWIGEVNGGFKLQLYGANWRTPLINCYYHFRELMVPESWGSGGIRIQKSAGGGTHVAAYSGPRELAAGRPLDFNFRLFLTPFKPLDTDAQWSLRYQHGSNDDDYRDLARVKAMGASVANIHQSREANPTINYPYFDQSMPLLKKAVASGHANGVKVKIYYTTREITNNLNELFAFWSLNGEIICASPGRDGVKAHPLTNGGGPHPWLVEHLGAEGYIPAWRDVLGGRYNGLLDLAVITTPDSRLDNFYCEGLAFTLRETGFDGMYIDDTSLGRKGFQRAHRIFEAAGKPLLADMHSWNHWDPTAGSTPSAYCYLQNFPYYHRIWYGEGFSANRNSPDYMLVEMSGIPFGLMSEMLDDPNPWRGMVFGMTTRLGWSGNPRPLWKFWDEFGMQGTTMSGWWNPACPIKTDHPNVLATVYRKAGKSLIALASWAQGRTPVKLAVNWKALGLDAKKTTLWAPAIEAYQREAVFAADGPIPVEPGRGWLLVAEETRRQVTAGPVSPEPRK